MGAAYSLYDTCLDKSEQPRSSKGDKPWDKQKENFDEPMSLLSKDSKACQEKDLNIKKLAGADDDDDNMFQDCIDRWKEKEKKIDEMRKQLKESEKKCKI